MANPAALLHEIFTAWTTSAGSALARARGLDPAKPKGADFTQHMAAARHLLALEEIIAALQEDPHVNAKPYVQALPRWRAFVFALPAGWRTALSRGETLPTDHDLELLEILAGELNRTTPKYTPETLGTIRAVVEEARGLLTEVTSIPESLRRHLFGLLIEVDRCVAEYETLGDFDLSKAVSRLQAVFWVTAETTKDPRWKRFVDGLQKPLWTALIMFGVVKGYDAIEFMDAAHGTTEIPPADDSGPPQLGTAQ